MSEVGRAGDAGSQSKGQTDAQSVEIGQQFELLLLKFDHRSGRSRILSGYSCDKLAEALEIIELAQQLLRFYKLQIGQTEKFDKQIAPGFDNKAQLMQLRRRARVRFQGAGSVFLFGKKRLEMAVGGLKQL